MALSPADNEKVRKFLMRHFGVVFGLTKPMARDGIDVTDAWIDNTATKPAGTSNQASYVAYLAANASDFSMNSDATQKSILFAAVLLFRAGLIDLVR